ncbi:MAG TPA: methyltransferase domain-containing protein [Solirubrobacterales bacterium]|nr:methyltransferase domain-containing protein [Solirubrobacterales bacterium]
MRKDAVVIIRDGATAHLAVQEAHERLERERPELLAEFSPAGLRAAEVDPVSVLDRYRSLGLRVRAAEGELPADPGELVMALDAAGMSTALLRLEFVDPPPGPIERLLPADRRLGRRWARRFPPTEPRTLAYDAAHRALISSLLDDAEWQSLFARGGRLPPGLGAGFDERCVEYPWLFSRRLGGRVLDAGSVLNHRHLIERLLPEVDDLTITTLAPEAAAFTELGVSYVYDDMRRLPFRDDWFDEVVCLSTLEHVGMDNSIYGAADGPAADPAAAAAAALGELLRVVRPGGRVHLSVPYGRREEHGWVRQLDRAGVDDLLAAAGAGAREEAIFRYTPSGWRRGGDRRVAGVAYNPATTPGEDGAVAARAVYCATITA